MKRTNVIRKKEEGGLNMIDIDKYILSLQAAWVNKLIHQNGKWKELFRYYITQIGLDTEYIWKLSFRCSEHFPVIKTLPKFYQNIIVAFNKAKYIKPFKLLSTSEIASLPIWGTEYFKVKNLTLYLRAWINCGIKYVKDLMNNGYLMNENELMNKVCDTRNIMADIYIIKNYVFKRLKNKDLSLCNYVKIKPLSSILYNNRYYDISKCKSKFFYNIYLSKGTSRGNMESIYAREFKFDNSQLLWKNVYNQKIVKLKVAKISEFNYKILQNILPNGRILSKWNHNVSEKCEYCEEIETTKHMLYECDRIKKTWKLVSEIIKVKVTWKSIVCGFPGYDINGKITCLNYIIGIIAYSIFSANSHCKFKKILYKEYDIMTHIRSNIFLYKNILNHTDINIVNYRIYQLLCEHL